MTFTHAPVFFIGYRYLVSSGSKRQFSFTSLISMAGMMLGVAALILVLSVINGSISLQRERTLITVPHGNITASPGFSDWQQAADLINTLPGILATAPYLSLEAMISQQGYHQVTQIRGIDPQLEAAVTRIDDSMLVGNLAELQSGKHAIILGRTLADNLRLYPGDAVNLTVASSNASSTDFDTSIHRFTVAGIFDVRFNIGSELAYIHLQDSYEILNSDANAPGFALRIMAADINQAAAEVKQATTLLTASMPEAQYSGEDWSVTEASLFNALKLEKILTGFMLMMIVAIGAFNIIATLVMAVSDKQADIAILRTMGASRNTILGIFIVQGALSGVLGIILGAIAGILLTLNFATVSQGLEFVLNPSAIYLLSEMPAILQTSDVLVICGIALGLSILATLYPAWKASRIRPAQVLRYE